MCWRKSIYKGKEDYGSDDDRHIGGGMENVQKAYGDEHTAGGMIKECVQEMETDDQLL